MIKIWDGDDVKQDVYLYLKENLGPKGVTVSAKDMAGNHLYNILTIHKGGLHFHNLKDFSNLPFSVVPSMYEDDFKRIFVSRS